MEGVVVAGQIVFAAAGAVVAELVPAGGEIGADVIEEGSVGLALAHNRFDGDATVLTGTEAEVRGAIVRLARALGAEVSAQMGVCKTCADALPSWAEHTEWGAFCSTECEQADR